MLNIFICFVEFMAVSRIFGSTKTYTIRPLYIKIYKAPRIIMIVKYTPGTKFTRQIFEHLSYGGFKPSWAGTTEQKIARICAVKYFLQQHRWNLSGRH